MSLKIRKPEGKKKFKCRFDYPKREINEYFSVS